MQAYNTVEEIEALMKATTSPILSAPKEDHSDWKKQLMGQFYQPMPQARREDDETAKVDSRHFEFIERARALPPMDLQPGEKNWIEKAKKIMADSEAQKVRDRKRDEEIMRAMMEQTAARQAQAREDEEKAAAEERLRRQIEEEAQRTDWDIL